MSALEDVYWSLNPTRIPSSLKDGEKVKVG